MATITAGSILDKVEIILVDETNVRWTEDELLGWLNEGQREIVFHKPDSSVAVDTSGLSAGTRQDLPSDGVSLIKCTRNMGADGSTPGRAVTLIDPRILDVQVPDWHSMTQEDTVKHYMFDIRDPRAYYVYPPNDGNGSLEVVYSSSPTECDTVDATLGIADIYSNALINYIMYRAYMKDADYTANEQRVVAAYETFINSLTRKDQREMVDDPSVSSLKDKIPSGE